MERENSQGHREKNIKSILSHGGKDETVDMGISPDTVTDPVNPFQTLKDVRSLRGLGRKPKKVSRK